MDNSFDIKILSSFSPAMLAKARELYVENKWIQVDESPDFPEKAFLGSAAVAGAFDREGILIGSARALSDGVSDAYIQDVLVSPTHRRQGIGRALVQNLVKELQSRGIDWIGVVGVPGTETFYRKCGLVPIPGHTLYLAEAEK